MALQQQSPERDEGPSEGDIARAERVAHLADRSPSFLSRTWKPLGIAGGLIIAALLITQTFIIPNNRDEDQRVQLVAATVTRVLDGRTLEVEVGGKIEIVRYIGVGTPEIGRDNAGLALELNRLWAAGKNVRLEEDRQDRDAEGNLLRYVYVDDAMINAALIAAGFASAEDPGRNDRYKQGFSELEAQARSDQRGLWATPGALKSNALLPRPDSSPAAA